MADDAKVQITIAADLAAIFENLTVQHAARADTQHPARQYPAKVLAQLFRATVVSTVS